MKIFNADVAKKLEGYLTNIKNPVKILFFTQEMECPACRETREFLTELTSMNSKLYLETKDFVSDKNLADKHSVDKIPAIILIDSNDQDHGVRFFGLPGGYEINSFVAALLEISGQAIPFNESVRNKIASINKKINIKVLVSLTCPYCADAVKTTHQLALANPHISAEMIDIGLFPYIAQRYQVNSVPKIIINETIELLGAQPVESILDALEKIK